MVKVTTESFSKKLNEISEGQFELIGNYFSSTVNVTILHKQCGRQFRIEPAKITSKFRAVKKKNVSDYSACCSHCSEEKDLKERESKFIDRLKEAFGDELVYVSGYVNNMENLVIKCAKCDTIDDTRHPVNLLNNTASVQCKNCNNIVRTKKGKDDKNV